MTVKVRSVSDSIVFCKLCCWAQIKSCRFSTSVLLYLFPFPRLHFFTSLFPRTISSIPLFVLVSPPPPSPPPPPFLTVKLSVWGLVINCPVWLCIWPMPTHGRGLSSRSISWHWRMIVLVWKKGEGKDGVLSVHVFIGESLEHKGVEMQMFSHGVYSFAQLNSSGRWKSKDFKGDR